MPTEANAPPELMSWQIAMAGFEVTLYGRIWVTPEVLRTVLPKFARLP